MRIIQTAWMLTFIILGCETAFGVPVKAPPSFLEVGSCAPFTLMDNFEVEKYLGKWYPVWNIPSSYISSHSCIVDTVTMSGKKMKVVTGGLDIDGRATMSNAKLRLVRPKNKKKKAYMELEAHLVPPVPYYIISTDYTSYSCVYSCYNLFGLKAELFWSYARNPMAAIEVQEKCQEHFNRRGLDISKMSKVNHEGCGHQVLTTPLPAVNSIEAEEVEVPRSTQDDNQGPVQRSADETAMERLEVIVNSDDEDETEGSGAGHPENTEDQSQHNHRHHCHKMKTDTHNDNKTIMGEDISFEEDLVQVALVEAEELERTANQVFHEMTNDVEEALSKNAVAVEKMATHSNTDQDDRRPDSNQGKEDKETYNKTSITSTSAVLIILVLVIHRLI